MNCIMDQNIWLNDIKTDRNDNPECEVHYIDSIEKMTHISIDYNLFDYTYGINRYIYLSELFKAHDYSVWYQLLKCVEKCDSITIVNDITLQNDEMSFIIVFYINAFYCQLRKHCPNCYINIRKC